MTGIPSSFGNIVLLLGLIEVVLLLTVVVGNELLVPLLGRIEVLTLLLFALGCPLS